MLDGKDEQTLAAVTEQLRATFGTRLVTVALYGSAAGEDYVPGVSDLNLVVVLDELAYTDLHALRPNIRRWAKRRVATPLLLDRPFLDTARDVFPMELYDIQGQHRVLFGDDVFALLDISDRNLRYQCEHEARGKLLRLRGLYLEIGERPRALRTLMLDSLKTFLIIMRNLNRLRGVRRTESYETVLDTFSQLFDLSFPVMARLLRVKLGKEAWSGDPEVLFRHYFEELRRLVQIIDRLPVGDAAGPPAA